MVLKLIKTKTKTHVKGKKNHGSMAYFCLDCNDKYVILIANE